LVYRQARAKWGLLRGPETFYDEDDYMIEFSSEEEAVAWAEKNLGVTPLVQEADVQTALFETKLENHGTRTADGMMSHTKRSRERDRQRALSDGWK
jgi:hypothetical protein